MTLRLITTAEKLSEVESLIEHHVLNGENVDVLREIAKDLRGRIDHAPSVVLSEFERRMASLLRTKTALGYEQGKMHGLAQNLIQRWPVVKQALEKFGADLEETAS